MSLFSLIFGQSKKDSEAREFLLGKVSELQKLLEYANKANKDFKDGYEKAMREVANQPPSFFSNRFPIEMRNALEAEKEKAIKSALIDFKESNEYLELKNSLYEKIRSEYLSTIDGMRANAISDLVSAESARARAEYNAAKAEELKSEIALELIKNNGKSDAQMAHEIKLAEIRAKKNENTSQESPYRTR